MPMITGKSRQYAIRFRTETTELLERDAVLARNKARRKNAGVANVVNCIVEKHDEKKLRKIREKKEKQVRC